MQYHMRRQDRQVTDHETITALLCAEKYIVIAMSKDDEPYIVTLSYGYDQLEHALYVHTGLEGHKMDVLRDDPKVCATVIQDGGYIENECGHAYCTVVIRGQMRLVDTPEEKRHGLEVLVRHLEKDPEPMLRKLDAAIPMFQKTAVFRLEIEELSCKKGR